MNEITTMVIALVATLLVWVMLLRRSRKRIEAMRTEREHQERSSQKYQEKAVADRRQARMVMYRREMSQRGLDAYHAGRQPSENPTYEEWAAAKGFQDEPEQQAAQGGT